MEPVLMCDVLVIGGGGAALRAAIAAKSEGADVLIISKGAVGRSGATYYSVAEVGAFNVPDGSLDVSDNPETFYEDMKHASRSMARLDLSYILADRAEEALHDLEQMPDGEKIFTRTDSAYKVYKACFSSKARSHVVQNHFKPILAVLQKEADRLGIRQISDLQITDLLIESGQCCGAYAIDAQAEPNVILAKSVVISTGGASQLFRKNMYPKDITGDGYAMGHRAGARLTNMEFLQAGIGMAAPSINLFQNYLWGGMPKITNRFGEEILSKYLPQGVSVQDVLTAKREHFPFSSGDNSKYVEISIQSEINKGNANVDGNVFLEFQKSEIERVLQTNRNFASMWPLTNQWYKELGVDLEKEPITIACFAHAINGGLLIDRNAETSIPGLYAAGETAAGPHGADRLGGNMSVTCQVFGKIAGINAAHRAKQQNSWLSAESDLHRVRAHYHRFAIRSGPVSLCEILQQIQQISNDSLLILRNAHGMKQYLTNIDEIEHTLRVNAQINSTHEWAYSFSLQNLLDTGRMMARAALLRTESRGSHYRTDYPEQNDAFAKNIILERGNTHFEE